MFDPLRLKIVKKLLDNSVGRMLELKSELIREDLSDFCFLDDILIDMKLTRRDLELKVPPHYRMDRREALQKWNTEIDMILANRAARILEEEQAALAAEAAAAAAAAAPADGEERASESGAGGQAAAEPAAADEEAAKQKEAEDEAMREATHGGRKRKTQQGAAGSVEAPSSVAEQLQKQFAKKEPTQEQKDRTAAIALIQRHERARKGRLYARRVFESNDLKERLAWHTYVPIPPDILLRSVKCIQRFWKGYQARLHLWARNTRMRTLIGELKKSYDPTPQKWKLRDVEELRRKIRKEMAQKWVETVAVSREKMLQSSEAQFEIADELRFFIEYWFRIVNELPFFPDEDYIIPPPGLMGLPKGTPDDFLIKRGEGPVESKYKQQPLGGSALWVAGYWVTPELYALASEAAIIAKKQQAGKKPPPKLTKDQIRQMKQEAAEEAAEKRARMEQALEEKRTAGVYPCATNYIADFEDILEDSRLAWRLEEPWQERAKLEVMKGVHLELRAVVDEVMRQELIKLQNAINIDRGKPPFEPPKKKKKKKKKRGKKDPTGKRTTESLFEELVEKNVIKKYDFVDMDDLYLDYGYCQSDLRADPYYLDPLPKTGDVKQILKEYCILNVMAPRPYVSPSILQPRGTFPPPIRSVLLFGPPNSGKRTLVDGICSMLGAVKFDLTPRNLKGHFETKKEIKMLAHLVSKMSRILSPSVIFLDGAHKPFYSRVPKDEKADNPKKIKAQLPKLVKEIKGDDDRVIFVCTSNYPWQCPAANLVKMYDKMVLIQRPDYGTRFLYLYHRLMSYHGVDRDFPVSAICKISQNFPIYILEEALQAVLTTRRISLLKPKPLDPQEILDYLLTRKEAQITVEQEQQYVDWYKTNYPLAVKKTAKIAFEKEYREKLAATQKKGKK